MARTFVLERDYPHPVGKVWKALTDPAQMGLWVMNFDNDPGEMTTDFRPVAGASYRIEARKGRGWRGHVVGQVMEAVPRERLVLTWAHSGYQDRHPARIAFTLQPTAGGTRLRMEQSNFPGLKGWFVRLGARLGWKTMLDKSLPGVLGSA